MKTNIIQNQAQNRKKKRIDLEVLRIIAIFFVLINHTGTNMFISSSIYGDMYLYCIYLFITSCARIAVPLFFMISGVLLLGKDESIGVVLRKRVLKYFIIILIFSIIQFFFLVVTGSAKFDGDGVLHYLIKMYVDSVVVPYWFLYAYLGLMILLPFIRKMVKMLDKNHYIYLIILHIFFFGVLQIFEYFSGLDRININLPFACDTSFFYFIVGYFVDNYININHWNKTFSMILAIFSTVFLTIMVYWDISVNNTFLDGSKHVHSSALIIFPTIFTFLIVKYFCRNVSDKTVLAKIVFWISSTSFGIYLLEDVFDGVSFDIFFICNKFFSPFISWIIWVCASYIIGVIFISFCKFFMNNVKRFIS